MIFDFSFFVRKLNYHKLLVATDFWTLFNVKTFGEPEEKELFRKAITIKQ